MSTTLIARKDFDDAIRSRMILAIVGIFVFFASVLVAAPAIFGDSTADITTAEALSLTIIPSETLVPIVSLIVGYMAIVGERQSGSIKMLLGFPHSRRDVVAGKFIGRTAVVSIGIVVGFTVAVLLGAGLYGSFPARDFAALLGVTLYLALVFVGFAVGVSAGTASRGTAMAIVIGMFILFNVFWQLITSLVLYAVEGGDVGTIPTWHEFLVSISPMAAYESAARTFLDFEFPGFFGGPTTDAAVAGDPFFLQDWFGFVILAVWMTVPLAIGYWRFSRADLG